MKINLLYMYVFSNVFLFISSCEFLKQDSPLQDPFSQASSLQDYPSQDSSSLPVEQSAPPVSSIQPDSLACETDSDCVLVNKGCCGCSAGGESIAIHKSQQNSYINELKESCALFIRFCPAWYRCDEFKAKCINFQCVADSKT